MRITYIKATGYVGIFQGTKLKTVYIDFEQGRHNKINVIKGINGSGKSTLLSMLNPYPDSNDCFIEKEYAEKEIGYAVNDIQYVINCIHKVNDKGERQQTKAYIKKITPNGSIELNENGNITSFKDILESEFGLDPNFIILSQLSSENKGIVDKTPGERKKMVSSLLNSVEVYNNILKVLTKRSSSYKSLMNSIVAKIETIGTEESLTSSLTSINNKLINLNAQKEMLTKSISADEAMINVLDPDMSIQNLFASIDIELESLKTELERQKFNFSYICSNSSFGSVIAKVSDLSSCSALYSEQEKKIYSLKSRKEEASRSISELLVSREEENRALQLKIQRMNALQEECNFKDIEKHIKICTENILQYEKFFAQINVKDALNISKDEYVSGLNTLKNIESSVFNIKSQFYDSDLLASVNMILTNKDPALEMNRLNDLIFSLNEKISTLGSEYSYFIGLQEKLSILDKRPAGCKIDNCEFIKSALEALSKDPNVKVKQILQEIEETKAVLNKYIDERVVMENIRDITLSIKSVLRNIKSNVSIIAKLPIGHLFLDENEFLKNITHTKIFDSINELYKYIDHANVFEEYKSAKDTLYRLKTDYAIYESKNIVIDELSSDIVSLNYKMQNISEKIDSYNMIIRDCDSEILNCSELFKLLDASISILGTIERNTSRMNELQTKLNAISDNMIKINTRRENIQFNIDKLNFVNSSISPLEQERDYSRYSLIMLKEYAEEYKRYKESYDMIEVIKAHSNPTANGIQNIFIQLYMQKSRTEANNLLSQFFNGRMYLEKYIIGEGVFGMPYLSNSTGMITDDVSRGSSGERAIISLIMSSVLLKQSSTKYDVLRLDELDGPLDTHNRLIFIDLLYKLIELLHIEQIFIISHSQELIMSGVNLIQLASDTNDLDIASANLLFKL